MKNFLKSLLISSLFLLGACENASIQDAKKEKIEIPNIDVLFELKKVSEEDLKNLWLPRLEAIEKIQLRNISDAELLEVSGNSFLFSNSLNYAAKKLLNEKQSESTKTLLLQLSARITNFTRKLRNLMMKSGKVEKDEVNSDVPYARYADTTWLTIYYNDNTLNILNLVNSIIFDDDCDNAEVIKYYLSEIVMRLNEAADNNVYQNTVGEIEFNNPELIKKLHEKLQKSGYEKFSDTTTKKFLERIRTFAEKQDYATN